MDFEEIIMKIMMVMGVILGVEGTVLISYYVLSLMLGW